MSYFGKGGRGGPSDTETAANRFGMLAEVRAYWEGLRRSGELPVRDDIDPRGIAGALENTFLLERVAPGVARFRLAGMQLHDLMGMDVRGMPVTALIDPAGRARMTDQLETVFAGPGTLEVWLEAERGIGRPALEARMLLLPLTSLRGTVDLALGCLAIHGALGRTPRRFVISGIVGTKIERRINPDPRKVERDTPERRDPVPVASLPGMAEIGLTFTPAFAPRPPRGKPNLRLVHSRD
ncbi:MAG: PAS domain-containing protein [Pseudorhodobacter sp.]|nr:PAS domain-containing protein [Pseudorhodobacter sp.]